MIHKDLKVWKDSIDLSVEVYKLTSNFPKEEKYGLSSQMRRSAISISSNLAEGAARSSTKEYIRFIDFSRASLSELDTQLIISKRLNYINEISNLMSRIISIKFMLTSLRNSLLKRIEENK